MYRLQVKEHFDAAHFIKDHQGRCSREHGHRFEVEVVLEGKKLDSMNMLVDFSFIKNTLKVLLDNKLDHWQLNQTLEENNVTAEFLAKWIYDMIDNTYWAEGVELSSVTVWESPDCCVNYYGD